MSIDRRAVNRALAKAIAYKSCGKDAEAASWARQVVELLECAEILVPDPAASSDPLDDYNYVGSRHHY